jgi:hypothetical protein
VSNSPNLSEEAYSAICLVIVSMSSLSLESRPPVA